MTTSKISSPLLQDSMREPAALIYCFLPSESKGNLRRSCRKMVMWYKNAIFLEIGEMGCFTFSRTPTLTERAGENLLLPPPRSRTPTPPPESAAGKSLGAHHHDGNGDLLDTTGFEMMQHKSFYPVCLSVNVLRGVSSAGITSLENLVVTSVDVPKNRMKISSSPSTTSTTARRSERAETSVTAKSEENELYKVLAESGLARWHLELVKQRMTIERLNFMDADVLERFSPALAKEPGESKMIIRAIRRSWDLETKVQDNFLREEHKAMLSLFTPDASDVSLAGGKCQVSGLLEFQQLKDLRVLPDNFCRDHVPLVTEMSFRDMMDLESIGDNFCSVNNRLTVFSLRNLPRLKFVGAGWLRKMKQLKVVKLEGLPCLAEVSHAWLSECQTLKEVSIVGLKSLIRIGDSFLQGCFHLAKVTVSDCPSLQYIGEGAFSEITSRVAIKLEGVPRLKTLPRKMLSCDHHCGNSPSLQINLSSSSFSFATSSSQPSVSSNCLAITTKTTTAAAAVVGGRSHDIAPKKHNHRRIHLHGIETLDGLFMTGACQPPEIWTGEMLPTLRIIGPQCFYKTQLTKLVLQDIPLLAEIGNNFGSRCVAMIEVQLINLPRLATIRSNFMNQNRNLKNISIKFCPVLTMIEKKFVDDTTMGSIHCVQLEGVPSLSTFQDISDATKKIVGKWDGEGQPETEKSVFKVPHRFQLDAFRFVGNGIHHSMKNLEFSYSCQPPPAGQVNLRKPRSSKDQERQSSCVLS